LKKRIFIGSFIRVNGLEEKYENVKKDFDKYILGRWTPLENLHITYKFIGEIDKEKIKEIHKILKSELDRKIETEIVLKGLNAFPNIYSPKILYISVEDKENFLRDCHKFIEDKLSLLGFPKSQQNFIPHITLMRIKKFRKNKFIQTIKKFDNFTFGIQTNIEINIIESILLPSGAKYKKLELLK